MIECPPPLLSVRDLRLEFDTFDGLYRAIDGVSFDLASGESLGIVGETGCGKSVTAKSILGLVPSPPARIGSGRILYGDEDLVAVGEARLRALRGVEIAMIFQDPMTYLNPVFTIGQQLVDVIMAHQRVRPEGERLGRRGAREHALEMLRRVRLPNPERQMDAYPYQLSGGMRQRVLIAQALSGNPRLLIADEPTTALDVTIQVQILDLIAELMEDLDLSVIMISHDLGVVASLCRRAIALNPALLVLDEPTSALDVSVQAQILEFLKALQKEMGLTFLFISHNLAVVRYLCARVAVMYLGRIVEEGATEDVFNAPRHPYTEALLSAVPWPEAAQPAGRAPLHGDVPSPVDLPPGCSFHARCTRHIAGTCDALAPPEVEVGPMHWTACHLYSPAPDGGQGPVSAG